MSGLFKKFPVIHGSKLKEMIDNEPDTLFIIDLRSPDKYSEGHIPCAHSIPYGNFDEQLNTIPKDKTVVLYCEAGIKSPLIVQKMKNKGYSGVYSLGGLQQWLYELTVN